jgi:hypothetical protein
LGALADIDLVAYRNRVTNVLQGIIDKSDTLQKIRRGEAVSPEDIEKLCSLVLVQEPGLDLHELDPVAGLDLKGLPYVGGDGDLALAGHGGGTHGMEFLAPYFTVRRLKPAQGPRVLHRP